MRGVYVFPLLFGCLMAGASHAAECGSLVNLTLPQTEITLAEIVPAGPTDYGKEKVGQPPNRDADRLPAYCRVAGTVEPAIRFEVWMPVDGWNGRFQGIGNHRFAGTIPTADMGMEMARGYAVAGTDTGHTEGDTAWMQSQQQLEDYGYRGIHEMTVKAKEVVKAFYEKPADYAYFNGCSTGGKQGLTQAQRYPEDYDGIVVGDPNNSQSGNRAQYVWTAQVTFAKPETTIPKEKLAVLNKAVMDACDGGDGLADGMISNPLECQFDVAVLTCSAGQDESQCLTPAQVEAVNKVYQGPVNPRTGESVYPGFSYGSELRWGQFVAGPKVFPTAAQFFGNVVFKKADWDYTTFDFDKDMAVVQESAAKLVDAVETDLSGMLQSGGKILHYHGWSDVNHTPLYTVRYYDAVRKTMGEDKTSSFYRLFMEPGGDGCGSDFDPLPPLVDWVEKGVAPDRIASVSRGTGPTAGKERPICAYPKIARWTGQDAASGSFTCE